MQIQGGKCQHYVILDPYFKAKEFNSRQRKLNQVNFGLIEIDRNNQICLSDFLEILKSNLIKSKINSKALFQLKQLLVGKINVKNNVSQNQFYNLSRALILIISKDDQIKVENKFQCPPNQKYFDEFFEQLQDQYFNYSDDSKIDISQIIKETISIRNKLDQMFDIEENLNPIIQRINQEFIFRQKLHKQKSILNANESFQIFLKLFDYITQNPNEETLVNFMNLDGPSLKQLNNISLDQLNNLDILNPDYLLISELIKQENIIDSDNNNNNEIQEVIDFKQQTDNSLSDFMNDYVKFFISKYWIFYDVPYNPKIIKTQLYQVLQDYIINIYNKYNKIIKLSYQFGKRYILNFLKNVFHQVDKRMLSILLDMKIFIINDFVQSRYSQQLSFQNVFKDQKEHYLSELIEICNDRDQSKQMELIFRYCSQLQYQLKLLFGTDKQINFKHQMQEDLLKIDMDIHYSDLNFAPELKHKQLIIFTNRFCPSWFINKYDDYKKYCFELRSKQQLADKLKLLNAQSLKNNKEDLFKNLEQLQNDNYIFEQPLGNLQYFIYDNSRFAKVLTKEDFYLKLLKEYKDKLLPVPCLKQFIHASYQQNKEQQIVKQFETISDSLNKQYNSEIIQLEKYVQLGNTTNRFQQLKQILERQLSQQNFKDINDIYNLALQIMKAQMNEEYKEQFKIKKFILQVEESFSNQCKELFSDFQGYPRNFQFKVEFNKFNQEQIYQKISEFYQEQITQILYEKLTK